MSNTYPPGFRRYKEVLQEKRYPHHFSEREIICHEDFAMLGIGGDFRDNPSWRYYEMIPVDHDQHRPISS